MKYLRLSIWLLAVAGFWALTFLLLPYYYTLLVDPSPFIWLVDAW
jgi:hypothetical protein